MRLLLAVYFLLFIVSAFAQNRISVTTQHNDLNRTGWNSNEIVLNTQNVASEKFGCVGTLSVDDQIYAQPLIINKVTIGNFTGSILYVATVNNSLYAFNADEVSAGAPLWQVNLNPAGQRAPDVADLKDVVQGAPCGGDYKDFSLRVGIVGTPVIDTISQTIYVASKTIDANGNFYDHLNALDIKTGQHRSGSPHLISATTPGTGEGSINGTVAYQAKFQNQRPALLLYNNTVYVASASYCDWGPYHGWVLGFDAATLSLKYTYNTTPNGWAGGIWMAGQGISVGDDGNLYLATGNGTTNPDNSNNIGGRSESLIKLSPQLKQLDWFTPSNYEYLDQFDVDYGSDGVLMIPDSRLTVSGSKEGISYVVDYDDMGKFNATNSQVKDTLEFNPSRQGYVHVHGSPVYAKLSTGEFVYAWAESFKIRQFTYNRSTGTFSKAYMQGVRNLDNGMPGAMLSLSSNGEDTSSALVWACFPTSGNANHQVRPGTVAVYRAGNVSAGELWNSDLTKSDVIGSFAKFNAPTIANGKVYVPTFSKAVKVYGIKCASEGTRLPYATGSGLKAEYFSNSMPIDSFPAKPEIVQLDPVVNFNWGAGSPAPAISDDNFKVRWSGQLAPLTDDTYSLYVIANDGVRLWIDNKLVIDSWTNKPVTTHSITVVLQKANVYDIKLEYNAANNASSCILQWSAAGVCKQNIPASQLFATPIKCEGNGNGLNTEYFTNTQPAAGFPSAATLKNVQPTVDFAWGQASPAAGISNDNFKARFTGFVQSLDAGTYTFYVTADDGIRLWVNNQLLIDKWIDQGTTEYSAMITLDACRKNAIRLEYYENGGDAVCKLEWRGPVTGRQVIPKAQLYTEGDPQSLTNEFVIFPNPNSASTLYISTTASLQAGAEVTIYNVTGQLVQKISLKAGTLNSRITIPHRLPAGMYVLRLQAGAKQYTGKFIVL